MPRKARIISSTGIYHIILRSVNQQIIFEEDSDYHKFLHILFDCQKKYDFDIYAYCLMSNHIHILINDKNCRLSSIFQSIGTRFARWYNQKYLRFGHLFQERFISRPVENSQYFLYVIMYIHNNPVKSDLCRFATDYKWSSAGAYYGRKDLMVDTSLAEFIVGSKELLLKSFARPDPDYDEVDFIQTGVQPRYYIDEMALAIFKTITNCKSPSDIQHMSKTVRNEMIRELSRNSLSYNQIARFCGITKSTVYRIIKNYKKM